MIFYVLGIDVFREQMSRFVCDHIRERRKEQFVYCKQLKFTAQVALFYFCRIFKHP